MPIHPDTGIVYGETNSSLNSRFAVYKDGVAINLNANWPRLDGGPLEGADPSIEFYIRVPGQRPEVDHRFTVTSEWAPVKYEDDVPTGYPVGEYKQVFLVERLPDEDLELQVDSAVMELTKDIYPEELRPIMLLKLIGAVAAQAKGIPLNDDQKDAVDSALVVGQKVAQVENWASSLKSSIALGADYDITDRPTLE